MKISNKIIRKLNPCYDPSEIVRDENEELPVREWVLKYRDLVKDKSDIIWLLCNKLYMSEKDIRLFDADFARAAASAATLDFSWEDVKSEQLDQLLTYFD